MASPSHDPNTQAVHAGTLPDPTTGGAVSPLYPATAYPYLETNDLPYPRYFNVPNHQAVAQKLAALEHAERGLMLASGMAAISTGLFTFLQAGDHAVFQKSVYGGTFKLITHQLKRFGITYSWAEGQQAADFAAAMQPNTKLVYMETPSNPLLKITDIAGVVAVAKTQGALTMIDNTFASPINQTPHDLGVDIVMHSATKYLGGHSDITAGSLTGSNAHVEAMMHTARLMGGSLAPETLLLLERSMKTLGIRVRQQTENAMALAQWLEAQNGISRVYYPGLESHPGHALAREQMHGFGAMLSFDVAEDRDPVAFQKALRLIAPVISLGAVETTLTAPALTSHAALSAEEQRAEGISDRTLRLSVGIEGVNDLQGDLLQALKVAERTPVALS